MYMWLAHMPVTPRNGCPPSDDNELTSPGDRAGYVTGFEKSRWQRLKLSGTRWELKVVNPPPPFLFLFFFFFLPVSLYGCWAYIHFTTPVIDLRWIGYFEFEKMEASEPACWLLWAACSIKRGSPMSSRKQEFPEHRRDFAQSIQVPENQDTRRWSQSTGMVQRVEYLSGLST